MLTGSRRDQMVTISPLPKQAFDVVLYQSATRTERFSVGPVGIEPTTFGLKARCSAN